MTNKSPFPAQLAPELTDCLLPFDLHKQLEGLFSNAPLCFDTAQFDGFRHQLLVNRDCRSHDVLLVEMCAASILPRAAGEITAALIRLPFFIEMKVICLNQQGWRRQQKNKLI
jgi:hypothetical protein